MTKEDYMHLPKERLAEMLAERDKQQVMPNTTPVYVPYYEPYPWWKQVTYETLPKFTIGDPVKQTTTNQTI